jgi:hypothetical protein
MAHMGAVDKVPLARCQQLWPLPSISVTDDLVPSCMNPWPLDWLRLPGQGKTGITIRLYGQSPVAYTGSYKMSKWESPQCAKDRRVSHLDIACIIVFDNHMIFVEEYNLWSSSLCKFILLLLHPSYVQIFSLDPCLIVIHDVWNCLFWDFKL